jgi:hypothetical protein
MREEGLAVYGFGEHKTPEAFRNACHRFVFVENLTLLPDPQAEDPASHAPKVSSKDVQPTARKPINPQQPKAKKKLPVGLLKEAVENTSDDTGWAHLGALGNYLVKRQPDFDSRSFGFKKLMDLFLALPHSSNAATGHQRTPPQR